MRDECVLWDLLFQHSMAIAVCHSCASCHILASSPLRLCPSQDPNRAFQAPGMSDVHYMCMSEASHGLPLLKERLPLTSTSIPSIPQDPYCAFQAPGLRDAHYMSVASHGVHSFQPMMIIPLHHPKLDVASPITPLSRTPTAPFRPQA